MTFSRSLAIGELSKRHEKTRTAVVSFFCDSRLRKHQKPESILLDVLRQLVVQGDANLVSALKRSYAEPSALTNRINIAEIAAEACTFQLTYLVIDGLDELDDLNGLLCLLPSLVEGGCRVLVTSRDLPNIRRKLNGSENMEIESNTDDLRAYVDHRFYDLEITLEKEGAKELKEKIVTESGQL